MSTTDPQHQQVLDVLAQMERDYRAAIANVRAILSGHPSALPLAESLNPAGERLGTPAEINVAIATAQDAGEDLPQIRHDGEWWEVYGWTMRSDQDHCFAHVLDLLAPEGDPGRAIAFRTFDTIPWRTAAEATARRTCPCGLAADHGEPCADSTEAAA